jgi:hypothetical protein
MSYNGIGGVSATSSANEGMNGSIHGGGLVVHLVLVRRACLVGLLCANASCRQLLLERRLAIAPSNAAPACGYSQVADQGARSDNPTVAASATTTRGNGDDDDECDDEESEAGADSSSSSGALSSINAWLCAGLTESESSSGTAAMMRTEAHFDGYHNLMCVELRRAKLRSAF